MSTTETPLLPGHWYHIYNRGINGETLYQTPANFDFFLKLLKKHVLETAKIYAYCLMKNHFHLLVSILENIEKPAHRYFSNLFNSYAQAFNKQQQRKGSLFERPFRRKMILSEQYRIQLVYYIHRNPVHHQVVNDFSRYQHSSFQAMLSKAPTRLEREEVFNWFGGRDGFIEYHKGEHDVADDLKLE